MYHPYGSVRHSEGTLPTDLTYTGQREVGLGLMHYGARYYHPALARFVSADTIVPQPGDPQSLNRYAYVYNRPLVYIDQNGHFPIIPLVGLVAAGVALLMMTSDVAPPPGSPVAHSRAGNQRVGERALAVAASSGIAVVCAPAVGATGGTGTATAAAELLTIELADGDDDEVQVAQRLLDALQASGEGRIPIDQLPSSSLMGRLQQLGEAAHREEEFAITMAEEGQMYLYQMSRWEKPLPLGSHWWWEHTHYGADPLEPSGVDQVLLWASGTKLGQFYFSILTDNQGNSIFFLPFVKPGFTESRGG